MTKRAYKDISSFLNAINNINRKEGYSYFFRGVANKKYATISADVPSIFRNRKEEEGTKWVDVEHSMFHRLISECPDYFNNCISTFEHLVMMQHYEFPTRLLDITSNPLVALYFACGGFSSLREGKITNLNKNGQVLVYEIKNTDIRNHNSDRVSILSNLTLSKPNINTSHFLINQLWNKNANIANASNVQIQQLNNIFKNQDNANEVFIYNLKYVEIFVSLFKKEKLLELIKQIIISDSNILDVKKTSMINESLNFLQILLSDFNSKEEWINNMLKTHFHDNLSASSGNEEDTHELTQISFCLSNIQYFIEVLSPVLLDQTVFNQFTYNIINEKSGFNPNLINPDHVTSVQCVMPKKNNPRIIAQQGLFLLFGLKAGGSKTDILNIDSDMYAKDDKNKIINIEIACKNNAKLNMLKQLKELGISNKTLFPEINNISYEVKKEFL